ncbi:hypothetical protein GQ55_1G060700 [Panicum hallii var. hallii]|uniref:Uncharacterized protein n=1 Tax=Panicum hallii var. hallii TaxID=1504633 RepID=A0A2T7F2S8_9POAL|nr:hypothetical protein GQ55_1G060700 [Panicum hallii var. hallii]
MLVGGRSEVRPVVHRPMFRPPPVARGSRRATTAEPSPWKTHRRNDGRQAGRPRLWYFQMLLLQTDSPCCLRDRRARAAWTACMAGCLPAASGRRTRRWRCGLPCSGGKKERGRGGRVVEQRTRRPHVFDQHPRPGRETAHGAAGPATASPAAAAALRFHPASFSFLPRPVPPRRTWATANPARPPAAGTSRRGTFLVGPARPVAYISNPLLGKRLLLVWSPARYAPIFMDKTEEDQSKAVSNDVFNERL